MARDEVIQPWLTERGVDDVEAFVPDMTGAARGKVLPADKFGSAAMKLPEAIFSQTVSGDFVQAENNADGELSDLFYGFLGGL